MNELKDQELDYLSKHLSKRHDELCTSSITR